MCVWLPCVRLETRTRRFFQHIGPARPPAPPRVSPLELHVLNLERHHAGAPGPHDAVSAASVDGCMMLDVGLKAAAGVTGDASQSPQLAAALQASAQAAEQQVGSGLV
jgi:hypothetical protein